jgi:putative transferase (TIGR04331 family)
MVERRLSDEYWVWGWSAQDSTLHSVPSPALSAIKKKYGHRDGRKGVFFVGNTVGRYQMRTWSLPIAAAADKCYIDLQIRFLQGLSDATKKQTIFRPYPHDWGLRLREKIIQACPGVHVQNTASSYWDAFKISAVVVTDMNTSTLLQGFAADIPTIAYWLPQCWELRPEAEPYFSSLRAAGILHDSPESAAAKVNEIIQNPFEWWDSPAVAAAKIPFRDTFAWTSDDWLSVWRESLASSSFFSS